MLGNEFLWEEDRIVGFVKGDVFLQSGGKMKKVAGLGLIGDVWLVGDGYTYCQVREAGNASKFVAYNENVLREKVVEKAHCVAELLKKIVSVFVGLSLLEVFVKILEVFFFFILEFGAI